MVGLTVITKFIGRPNHHLQVLRDENIVNPENIILGGHGNLIVFIIPKIEKNFINYMNHLNTLQFIR